MAQGIPYEQAFAQSMTNASVAAKEHAIATKGATGSTDVFVAKQKTAQAELKATATAANGASIAMKALSIAGNMLAMWAISKVIQIASEKFDELAHSVENCKERVDNLMSSYDSAISSANDNAKRIEEMADDYETLSKGVNSLGENVSLTSDEYEKYNDLVNEIAEMFPTLVQGYTDEGNAILNLKGNVEELRDAYKEAQKEAYNLLIVSGEDSDGNDIIKQWNDTRDTGFWAGALDLGAEDIGGGISVSDALDQLKTIQKMTADQYREIKRIVGSGTREEIAGLTDIQKDIGYGSYLYKALGLDSDVSNEEFANIQKQAKALVQTYNAEIESALSDIKTLANAYLMTNEDYDKLDAQSKTAASMVVNSLNESIANRFSSKEDVAVYVDSIVQAISSNDEAKDALTKLFTMDTSNMPIGEIKSQVDSYIDVIAKALNENPVELKTRLGFEDFDTTVLLNRLIPSRTDLSAGLESAFTDAMEGIDADVATEWVNSLTEEEAKLANSTEFDQALERQKEQITKTASETLSDLQQNLEDEYQKVQDWGLEDYAEQIKNGTIQSVFGNVDMDKRTIINWSDELKQTYQDALASWDYDPEVGSIDTVFGGSGRFGEDLNGIGWEVAFTPILPDGTFLSKDTVYNYINSILTEAYADDGKVTEEELTKIDAQGRQIGNTFVKGIFAAIDDSENYDNNGNWAETVGRLMHFSGDFGAVKIAKRDIDEVKTAFDNATLSANNYSAALQEVKNAQNQIDTDKTNISTRSISQVIDQLNTQLKPTFDALKDAYQDIFTVDDEGKEIFTLENVDLSMLDDIKSTIDKINVNEELGITIDYSSFENLANVLTNSSSTADDVHKAINELAGTIIQSLNPSLQATTTESYQLTQSMLESLGVMNSEEVMASALGYSLEELTALRQAASDAGFDLANATDKEISMFIWEQTESGNCAEALYLLQLKKVLLNNTNLNMSSDIEYILGLASSAGIASSALGKLAEAKSMLDTAIKKNDSEGIRRVQSYVRELETQIKNDVMNFEMPEIDFSPKADSKNKKSSSKSEKDTTESFDWIERAIESLQKRFNSLQQVIDSTFSTTEAKTKALANQIGLINKEIELQQYAYEEYMAKAESIGLSDNYKNLVQNGAINIEDITDKDLQEAIKSYQEYYDKAQDTLEEINSLHEDALQKHVDCYELEADELKSKLDSQSITEKQYIDEMLVLWEKYYANQVDLAEVAKEKKLELLDEEKSYLQSVANAATALLDNQIDDLEDQKDSAVQVYKDQIEVLENLKKPLEEQLEMMEKAREKEEKILALQKAQAALKRAENQRDQYKYVNGQMIYTADNKAIRDAKNDVSEAEFELAKFKIQEQIDEYDRQIDKLNELIDQTEKYYDNQIDGLNKYKDEWQKALDMEELAINMKNFTDMFGENSIGKLLSGDTTLIANWKQSYLDTLAEIDTTSTGTIGEITKQFADLAGIDLSNTSAQTQDIASQFDTLGESVGNVTASIGSPSNGEDNKENGNTQTENKEESSDTLVGAIQSSYDVASEAIPAQVEMMNSYAESIHNVTNEVNELISSLERLSTMSMSVPSLGGNAYASGTHKAEKGLALVGEEKPEAIITNDDKVILAEKPSLVNMEGGETVYNGDETEKLLEAKGIRPLRPEDSPILYKISQMNPDDIREKFGISSAMPVRSVVSDTAKSIANSNVVNNNSKPSMTVNGGINVTCPGVTSKEVMNQVGTAIQREIGGIYLEALQEANITR